MKRLSTKLALLAGFAAFALSSCFGNVYSYGYTNDCSLSSANRAYARITANTDNGSDWKVQSGTGIWSGATEVPSVWRSSGGSIDIGGRTFTGPSAGGQIILVQKYTGDTKTLYISAVC